MYPSGVTTFRIGVGISRSSVQRILREKTRGRSACARRKWKKRTARTPCHVLHPKKINRTWRLDLTVLTLFGMRFHVAAIVDGFSRELLAFKARARMPTVSFEANEHSSRP